MNSKQILEFRNNEFCKSVHSLNHLLGINNSKNIINIFTDGSYHSSKNKKVGYSFVVEYDENVAHVQNGNIIIGKSKKKLGALYAETVACLKAVEYVINKKLDHVIIYTDSMFIYRAIKDINVYKNPVLSAFTNTLYKRLKELKSNNLNIDFKYIKAHHNCEGNIIADVLAKNGRKGNSHRIYNSSIDKELKIV